MGKMLVEKKEPQTLFEEFGISEKKFLVTGGAGFIGSHLVEDLVLYGAKNITVLDNFINGNLKNLENLPPNINVVIGDIRNKETVDFHVKNSDIVFHLASLINANESIENPYLYKEVIYDGTKNIAISTSYNQKKLIYASSFAVYGDSAVPCSELTQCAPMNPYGYYKLQSEQLIMKLGGHIARFSNVYGERQSAGVVPALINKHLNNVSPTINNYGEQTRDFIYVKDITTALIVLAVLKESGFNIFNICSGKSITINNLNSIIRSFTKSTQPPTYTGKDSWEVIHSCGNNNRITTYTTWKPNWDLNTALYSTVEYYKHILLK